MVPLGWLTFAAASAARTSSSVRPVPASADGSTWTRTAGFCPPFRVTRPTPETCEIFCARTESAKSSTWLMGRLCELTESVRTGVSAGLDLEYVGGDGSVLGKKFAAPLIDACTSCSAASMLRSRLNCSVICDVEKLDTDVICASDGTCPNCRSSGVVTADAMVSALAPGNVVVTTIVG